MQKQSTTKTPDFDNESIKLEKEHWKREGENFLNSTRYLSSLTVKKTKEK